MIYKELICVGGPASGARVKIPALSFDRREEFGDAWYIVDRLKFSDGRVIEFLRQEEMTLPAAIWHLLGACAELRKRNGL